MADAAAMIARCMARQQGEAAYVTTARGTEAPDTSPVLPVGDAGLLGHRGTITQFDDRRDDGTPVVGDPWADG